MVVLAHTYFVAVALLSLLPFYLLLAIGMRKTMTVSMPLCSKHLALRTWMTAFGSSTFLWQCHRFDCADAIDSLVDLGWHVDGDFIRVCHWLGRNPVWVVRFEEDVAWVQNVHPSILERESIPVWEEQDWSW